MGVLMRVAQVLLCPVFAWFASLQFNDPDALPWVLIYSLVSLLCLGAAFGRVTVVGCTVLAVVTISWAAVLSVDVSDHIVQRPNASAPGFHLADDETVREVAGLLLAGLWCIISGVHAVRRKRWQTEA